jgi:CMP-N-acetylneuraminic acid synthetase|tara:strand:+ start:177 stop:857 length:681 start_codon:yes stop_codon:yes gene_type:complete
MTINCIILAREKSKRLKNKNLLSFNNKPLIYWTLKNAFKSKIFKKILISSDWIKLLNYSKSKFTSLIVDKRSKKLSTSTITSEAVIKYLLRKYKLKDGYTVLLQPTSPLRKTNYIKKMIKILKKNNLKTLHSVSTVVNKTLINKDSNIFNLSKKNSRKNFFLNGSIYIFKNNYFLQKNTIRENPGNYFFNEKEHSLDLDSVDDLKKFKIKYYYNKNSELIANSKIK